MRRKHIVFYGISFFMGCFLCLCYINKAYLGAVLTASFLYLIFINEEIVYFIIIVGFLVCGILRFNLYFRYYPNVSEKIRIISSYDNYVVGEVKGRKINITGEIEGLEEGRVIFAQGKFSKNIKYEKGIIGNYDINTYKNLDKDLIYYFASYKNSVINKLSQYLDDDKLALVVSLCFGDVSLLHEVDMYKLQKLGIVHAVSVSGFHISIVYKFIQGVLGVRVALIFALLYAIFTGLGYSTIRAFVMIFIVSISSKVHKKYDGISSLTLAFLLILLYKPYSFMEMGFALSFLATLGIILHYNHIKSFLKSFPKNLQDTLGITLSAQIFTLPYIAFTMNDFSLGFILGNVFLVPVFSFIVIIGNLSLFLTKFTVIFEFLAYILYIFCSVIQYISYILVKITPSMYYLGFFEGVYFMILYLSYIMIRRGVDKFKIIPLISFVIIFLNIFTIFPTINFIDNEHVSGAIIKYNSESVMVCNYNLEKGKEIINIKDSYGVKKVITDIDENLEMDLRNYKANILYNQRKIVGIKLTKRNSTLFITPNEENSTYKLIFNRIFKWRSYSDKLK